MDQNQTQLDPDAVNLAKAIRQTETGGKFDARGSSGEYGAYQYTPDTWAKQSSKYLGTQVPLEQATPEQQNEVAYKQIKEWKDAGRNPGEIASMWNAGEDHADAYQQDYTGTNSHGVKFDTPAYAKKVATAYQQIKQGGGNASASSGYNPTPFSKPNPGASIFDLNTTGAQTNDTSAKTADQNPSLGQELTGRLNDAGSAISNTISGKINPLSGVIQTGGAVAGALGDTLTKGLENAPLGIGSLFKGAEGLVGQGVSALANTGVGKSVIKGVQGFSAAHPELSKDLSSGFDIATAIPLLKGLGLLKNVAMDSVSSALKGTAEKVATKDFTTAAGSTIGGRNALAKGGASDIKTLIDERALPAIQGSKYSTEEAHNQLGHSISQIENNELQPALAKASTQSVADRQPLEELRQQAIANITKEMKGTGDSLSAIKEVNRKFDGFKNEYGDYVTLQDMNDMKRGVRSSVNFNSPKLDSDVSYHLGQTFQKSIEDSASKLGLGDVGAINEKMSRLIKAQNMLKHIEGRPVKTGVVGNFIKDTATAGGELAGNATGVPLAGAYLGREGGGIVGKKLAGVKNSVLSRTGKNAKRQTAAQIKTKGSGLFGGVVANKANQKVESSH